MSDVFVSGGVRLAVWDPGLNGAERANNTRYVRRWNYRPACDGFRFHHWCPAELRIRCIEPKPDADTECAGASGSPEPPAPIRLQVDGRRRTDGGKAGLELNNGRKTRSASQFKSSIRVFSAILTFRCLKIARGVEFEPALHCRPPTALMRLLHLDGGS
eukprot:SAG31_NODE_9841_length_1221_cov_1.454545_1_plen_159_part_00